MTETKHALPALPGVTHGVLDLWSSQACRATPPNGRRPQHRRRPSG
jgi:hypothetical protein